MWNYPWSNYALLSCWNRIPIEERISSRRLKFKPIQSLLHWPTTTVNDREWRTTITTGPLLLRIDSGRSSLNIQFYQHRIRNIPSGGSLLSCATSDPNPVCLLLLSGGCQKENQSVRQFTPFQSIHLHRPQKVWNFNERIHEGDDARPPL